MSQKEKIKETPQKLRKIGKVRPLFFRNFWTSGVISQKFRDRAGEVIYTQLDFGINFVSNIESKLK